MSKEGNIWLGLSLMAWNQPKELDESFQLEVEATAKDKSISHQEADQDSDVILLRS